MADLQPTRPKRFRDLSFFRKRLKGPPSTHVSDQSISNSNPRWQPKVTVYRLLVVPTTISLESAKVVTVFYRKSYVSTTIEWISGVVLVLSTLLSSTISHTYVILLDL